MTRKASAVGEGEARAKLGAIPRAKRVGSSALAREANAAEDAQPRQHGATATRPLPSPLPLSESTGLSESPS